MTDLPAPKRPIAPAFAAPEVDLPSPARGSTPFDDMVDDLDLPMPKGGETDLPALKGGGYDLDLPMPKGASDLDLPTPKASGFDLDLPAPKGFDLDLPMPKAGGLDLDLPTPRGDLPAPKGGGYDLDLPSPKDDYGALDLGGGFDLDLPAPRNDLPAPGAGRAGITDLPAPRNDLPAPKSDIPGMDDDLALPDPRARAPRASAPQGAGGPGFGEIDLGGGGDGLEFADLPQEETPRISSPGKDVPKAPTDRKTKSKREKASAAPKKKGKGLLVFVVVLLLIAGAGVALRWTPYGIFGVYALEGFRPEAGDDAGIARTLSDAETLAATDTYADVRASLRQLGTARRELYLNRQLLARSVVHEALFQIRFGESPRSEARENALLQRLEIRGNDAPGMSLALAAHALRAGQTSEVPAHLSAARSQAPSDPYVSLVAGEHALASGQPAAALEAFGAAGEGGGARALWGVARAHLATPEADSATVDAAIAAVLAASPDHGAALVARARRAFATGDETSALRDASLAAGTEAPEGREPIVASDRERADAWTLLGQIHEARGRRGPARVAYEKAIEADPFRVEALLGAGRVLLVERRFREALALFESAQESSQGMPAPAEGHPYDVQAKLGQIEALLPLEQHQQALTIAAALTQQLPANPAAALWHGRALGALEEDEAAKAELDRAIELAPSSFDGYLALAQLHFGNDDAASANEVLLRARDHVPESATMRRLLGDSELRRGNLDAAERELRAALALEAAHPESLFLLATTLRRARRLGEAERTLEQLAAIDGAYPGLSLERGRLFEAMGQASRAADAYARALAESPEDLDLELRLGAAQLAAGRVEDAEPHLRNVLRQRPDSAEAEHFVGRLFRVKGDGQAAIQHLTRARDLDPQIAEYRLHLGWAQLESNQLGAASDEIAAALAVDPQLPEAFLVRGLLGNRTGAVRDAKVDFERALALRPTLHEARAGLGDALDQLGDRPGAIRAYEAAVAADGTQPEWWYRLGRVRFDAGRAGEAVAALGRAIELGGATERRPIWLAESHRIRGEAHRLAGNRAGAIADYRQYLELAPASALDRQDVQDRLFDLGAR